MALFANGKTEELLMFIRNFQMNLIASVMLTDGAKIKYPRTLVHGEALRQLDTVSAEVWIATSEH